MERDRARSVFVNCPFDRQYKPLFDAIVFTITYCGFDARSALAEDDSADVRLTKIIGLIKDSRYSIHDISRIELDRGSNLPRFNMPLELGAAIGLINFGNQALADHQILILDTKQYRYQQFVSDLAGVDIRGHDDKALRIIGCVRNFLSTKTDRQLPSPSAVNVTYRQFRKTLPELAKDVQQTVAELTYNDRLNHLRAFLDKMR